MAHDPELVAETRAWLVKACGDLAAAAHELKAEPPFSGDAAFHAQQTVEKSLKAFLTWSPVPVIRDINLLERPAAAGTVAPKGRNNVAQGVSPGGVRVAR